MNQANSKTRKQTGWALSFTSLNWSHSEQVEWWQRHHALDCGLDVSCEWEKDHSFLSQKDDRMRKGKDTRGNIPIGKVFITFQILTRKQWRQMIGFFRQEHTRGWLRLAFYQLTHHNGKPWVICFQTRHWSMSYDVHHATKYRLILTFIYSFSKHFPSAYYVLPIVLHTNNPTDGNPTDDFFL